MKRENKIIGRPEGIVHSFTNPDKKYTISDDGALRCNCPAWHFKNGIDQNGHCKHIRAFLKMLETNGLLTIMDASKVKIIELDGEKFEVHDIEEAEDICTKGVQL